MKTLAAMLAGAFASVALAHHSNTAFDMTRSVVWQVEVTGFRFVNPHAYVYFTMDGDKGARVEGRCELASRTALTRLGWTLETLRPGEKLTINGAPGRNEANVCYLNSFTRADGTRVGAHEPLE
jgi:hypothetical protein